MQKTWGTGRHWSRPGHNMVLIAEEMEWLFWTGSLAPGWWIKMWALLTSVAALLLLPHHICLVKAGQAICLRSFLSVLCLWFLPHFSTDNAICCTVLINHSCSVQSPGTRSLSPAQLLGDALDHCGSPEFHSLAGAVILHWAFKETQCMRVSSLSSPKHSPFISFLHVNISSDIYRFYRYCSLPSIHFHSTLLQKHLMTRQRNLHSLHFHIIILPLTILLVFLKDHQTKEVISSRKQFYPIVWCSASRVFLYFIGMIVFCAYVLSRYGFSGVLEFLNILIVPKGETLFISWSLKYLEWKMDKEFCKSYHIPLGGFFSLR